jgi:hypothetical protein
MSLRQQALYWLEKYEHALETSRKAYNRIGRAMLGVNDPEERARLARELTAVQESMARIDAQRRRWQQTLRDGRDPARPSPDQPAARG